MKIHTLVCIFSLVAGAMIAQTTQTTVQSNHKMSITGTSSLHDWESEVTEVTGTATLDLENESFNGITSLKLKIPVKSIISEKGRIMNNKTYDALLADKHPNITFNLTDVSSLMASGSGYKVTAKGQLTIAGVTKTVTLKADATVHNNGVRFKGSYPMKMSTFGIDPPTAMLGALKTGDDITIHYDINLQ